MPIVAHTSCFQHMLTLIKRTATKPPVGSKKIFIQMLCKEVKRLSEKSDNNRIILILTVTMVSPGFTPALSAGESASTEIMCTSQA